MDLRLVIRRGLTLTAAVLLSLVPVALLLALFWPRLLSLLAPDDMAFLVAAVIVVGVLIPVTRDAAARFLDRYVYRTQANFQRTVRDASRGLTRELHLDVLLDFLTRTVTTATAAEGAAIFVGGDEGGEEGRGALKRAALAHGRGPTHFDAPDALPAAVFDLLARTSGPVLADELGGDRGTPDTEPALAELTRFNWALVLPVLSEATAIGAIALGPKLSGDPYYPQDLDLLTTLTNQAGVAIKNAQLYAQVVLANEYIENIVATLESGVVAVDAADRITMFNPSAERLTGVAAGRGHEVRTLPAGLAQALTATVADGEARTLPDLALPAGGGSRPTMCTTSPLRDAGGRVVGAVAVFSDLTPLKELEAERRRAERLAYFEMLAAGIAHELKNPLVAIKTFVQLMPRRRTDAHFVESFSQVVSREIDRVEQIVQRLRALSRPADRPRGPVDLRAPAREALEFLQPALEEKGHRVLVELGERPVTVLGDDGELEELFLNLFMNAHEAMPPGGTLTVQLTATAQQAVVAVTDTGPGIPPELVDQVFDPFFTTKQRGSGLGLAISAGIAHSHGARLRVTNRPAGGAVFTLEFPLLSPVPAAVPA